MISKVRQFGSLKLLVSHNHRFFSNLLKIPGASNVTFPLNFNGITFKSNDKSHGYQSALEQIFDTNLQDGFKLAYKSTLDAFVNEDVDFLKDICEPKFYREIEKGFEGLNQAGLKIDGDNLDTDDISTTINSLSMVYGVQHDRKLNDRKDLYLNRDMDFNGVDIKFYQPMRPDPSFLKRLHPFIQISCMFYSKPLNIVVKNKDGQVIAGLGSNKYHKFVFESVNESAYDGVSHIQNLAKSMGGLFGASGMFGNHNAMRGFIQNLFGAKDLTWKIADIDDHLGGNPFVV